MSAAAGSGKMAVLVGRIIQMISEGDRPLDIDQLLVMTFTSAATVGMWERIGVAVEQKLKERSEDEHLQLQATLIPQAQTTTIDNSCPNTIHGHYNSLDTDLAFRIGDGGSCPFCEGTAWGKCWKIVTMRRMRSLEGSWSVSDGESQTRELRT